MELDYIGFGKCSYRIGVSYCERFVTHRLRYTSRVTRDYYYYYTGLLLTPCIKRSPYLAARISVLPKGLVVQVLKQLQWWLELEDQGKCISQQFPGQSHLPSMSWITIPVSVWILEHVLPAGLLALVSMVKVINDVPFIHIVNIGECVFFSPHKLRCSGVPCLIFCKNICALHSQGNQWVVR